MPELPEVETVRRTIASATAGYVVGSVRGSGLGMHGGRPIPLAAIRRALRGQGFERWERRGKHLLGAVRGTHHLLHVHLGMSGRLVVGESGSLKPAHTHLELELRPDPDREPDPRADADSDPQVDVAGAPLSAGPRVLRLIDPRRFGRADLLDATRLATTEPFASMGPEPLDRGFSAAYLAAALAGSRRPIKVALLDQALVAGVGNIYASEALHRAHLDPRRPAASLDAGEAGLLVRAIKETLRQAIRHCGTTFSDYRDGWGFEGRFQGFLRVFERGGKPCRVCGAEVTSFLQHGRTTYACLACQR